VDSRIHPKFVNATVHCACGETWQTRSTKSEIRLEILFDCPPRQRTYLIDIEGRVKRFNRSTVARRSLAVRQHYWVAGAARSHLPRTV